MFERYAVVSRNVLHVIEDDDVKLLLRLDRVCFSDFLGITPVEHLSCWRLGISESTSSWFINKVTGGQKATFIIQDYLPLQRD